MRTQDFGLGCFLSLCTALRILGYHRLVPFDCCLIDILKLLISKNAGSDFSKADKEEDLGGQIYSLFFHRFSVIFFTQRMFHLHLTEKPPVLELEPPDLNSMAQEPNVTQILASFGYRKLEQAVIFS